LNQNEISIDKAVKLGDRTYKNYLDGYNQMDAISDKGASQ
jgi:arylsulfatase